MQLNAKKRLSNANILGKNALNHVTHWLILEDNVETQSCDDALVGDWLMDPHVILVY